MGKSDGVVSAVLCTYAAAKTMPRVSPQEQPLGQGVSMRREQGLTRVDLGPLSSPMRRSALIMRDIQTPTRRYPYRLVLNVAQNRRARAWHFREHATVSPGSMPWIDPDHRHCWSVGFARASAGEVWYAGGDTDGRWHLCSEGNLVWSKIPNALLYQKLPIYRGLASS